MSESGVVGSVVDTLTRLEQDVDALAGAGMDSCTDDEVLGLWRRLETIRRKLEPVDHKVIAEVESRSLPYTYACKNAAALARHVLRVGPGEASARVKAAHRCGPRRTLSGDVLLPAFPAVAAAQASGQVSAQHARVITEMITKLPQEVSAELGGTVEDVLVEFATEHDPVLTGRHAHDLAYALDQDGQYDEAQHRERTRAITLRRRADGSGKLEGELTAECAEHLATALDAFGKPTPTDRAGHADETTDADASRRTPTQRRHDAFLAMLKQLTRAELMPDSGGCSATVLLSMSAEAWASGTGTATTGHGYTVPADVARQWAGAEARVLSTVLSRTRGIEAYSSIQRLFTEQQRLALIARDRGCSFPGCDAPPQRCEVHHVTEHQNAGRTRVDNAALLCSFNHRHFDKQGWACTMINGRPWWTPPKWLDPDQVPRRNTMHDHGADP